MTKFLYARLRCCDGSHIHATALGTAQTIGPPLTQEDSKRPRLESERALGSPAASGPAGAATAAAAAGAAAAATAVAAAGAVAAAAAPAVTPAAADGAPGGPLLLAELEDEEGDGWPEDGTALGEFIYGENTPKAGGSSRRGSAVPKGVWVFVKRIKHPGLRTRLLANGQIMQTHVCIKCVKEKTFPRSPDDY